MQQQVAATDHSVCSGSATICMQQHVAATHRSDKSLRVYWGNFVKIFVSSTEFCRCNNLHKFCQIWFFATCCCDKILLQRKRFSQNFSSTHEAICRCDVSSRCCCNLSPSVYRPLSLGLNPCHPISRWASLAYRQLSLFLCSCSTFQICGHDNLSKLNTLDNTDTETISAFRFRLYWLFSCLCFTRRGWLCDFPSK